MGVLKFRLPDPLPPGAAAALDRLRFAAGYDRTPFPSVLEHSTESLNVLYDLTESGYISTPWPLLEFGFPVILTATLREKPTHYHLLTELARGKLNQIRNMAEDWKLSGFPVPESLVTAAFKATEKFVHAVVEPAATDSDASAQAALAEAFQIAAELVKFYISESVKLQQARISKPATRCSSLFTQPLTADEAELYLGAFEVVTFAPHWAEIESAPSKYDWSRVDQVVDWATGQGRPVILGPLIDLAGAALPKWLNMSDGDVPTIAAYFCDFVETAVLRYKGKVRDWVLCTGFNHADLHNLNQDDRLRLVVRVLESARGADPEGRWVIGVSQPWGEYLDKAEHTLSPLVFCDTLLRTGLSISGFNLEIVAGPSPHASQLRDGLELLRLFELYSLLGVSLDVTASHPGRMITDSTPQNSGGFSTCFKASESADSQAEWGGLLAALVGTMSNVRCFTWNRWKDDGDARGLVAHDSQPKPLLFRLQSLRHGFGA